MGAVGFDEGHAGAGGRLDEPWVYKEIEGI